MNTKSTCLTSRVHQKVNINNQPMSQLPVSQTGHTDAVAMKYMAKVNS